MQKGRFLAAGGDQILVTGEKGALIMAFGKAETFCSGSETKQTDARIIWKGDGKPGRVIAGDFNGDRRSELLEIDPEGSWRVSAFDPAAKSVSPLREVAQGKKGSMPSWEEATWRSGITAGRFLPGLAGDVLLTVSKHLSEGSVAYALHRLNLAAQRWDPLYGSRQGNTGRTAGIDTLKPEDRFLFVQRPGNRLLIYRYNRDWRYDLKEITFNDTTFTIVAGVDFAGYEKDRNPKYYESLTLVPGSFHGTPDGSVLAVGHVSAARRYQATLPDFIQLYSPGKK
jgi:hypothetical protein